MFHKRWQIPLFWAATNHFLFSAPPPQRHLRADGEVPVCLSLSDDHHVQPKPSSSALHAAVSDVPSLCRYRGDLCLWCSFSLDLITGFMWYWLIVSFSVRDLSSWWQQQQHTGVQGRIRHVHLQHIQEKNNANQLDQRQILFCSWSLKESDFFKFHLSQTENRRKLNFKADCLWCSAWRRRTLHMWFIWQKRCKDYRVEFNSVWETWR